MAYTAAQQAQLDAANEKITSAQTAYDNAVKTRDVYYEKMRTAYNDSAVGGDCYANQPSFEGQVAWGKMSSGSCKTKATFSGIVPKCPKCILVVAQYNGAYNNWQNASGDVASKDSLLTLAKNELATLLTNLGEEIANDPDFQNEQLQIQTQAEQEGKTLKTRWWIFGIIALVLIVGIGIIYFKFIKK